MDHCRLIPVIRPLAQARLNRALSARILYTSATPEGESEMARARISRKPVRLTITLAYSSYCDLERISGEQGRSMSNLAAFLLEGALNQIDSRNG